ncbi:MAG: metallophosphoesterase [Kofleriaceae bacterium]
MIRITAIEPEPLGEVRYLNAVSSGRTEVSRLEIVRARVGRLADELDALVCCSDLQGMVNGELLGVTVAAQLAQLADDGVLPPSARTGIVLAGDLYSVPAANRRGGYGDVATVWRAFAERFPWVVGVAGNHDDMTNVEGDNLHVLDGTIVEVDGLRFAGVGGIVGNPSKPGRREEDDQLTRISNVIEAPCDVLVLHEGPSGNNNGQAGNAYIRKIVEVAGVPLTVCGHAHWELPLADHARGQILNVDARVVVMQAFYIAR